MSKLRRFLQQINLCGIHLWPEAGELGYDGPEQGLTPDLLQQLKAQRTELLHCLNSSVVCPASYGQQGLWMIQQQAPQHSAYNVSMALQLRGLLNLPLLRDVIQLLVNRHESLRTRFFAQAERLVQQVDGYQPAAIEELEAFGWEDSQLQCTIKQLHERPFDLAQGPLFRTTILHHGPTQPACYSRRTIASLMAGRWISLLMNSLPSTTTCWRVKWSSSPSLSILPVELTTRLTQLAQQQQCTLFVLLLSAYQVLLQRYSGETTLLVGLPMAGRTRLEFEQIVGYFVSPVVLCTELMSEMTFLQVLAQVRKRLLAAFDHQEYPFARLMDRRATLGNRPHPWLPDQHLPSWSPRRGPQHR